MPSTGATSTSRGRPMTITDAQALDSDFTIVHNLYGRLSYTPYPAVDTTDMVAVGEETATTQPLISAEQRSRTGTPTQDEHHVADAEDDVMTAGWFLWLLTLAAGVSGLLFGYDTGVISSTLISVHSDLSGAPLSTLSKSLITSSTSLFALLASPITGPIADRLGRRPVLLLASCLFVIGALSQAVSTTVWAMIIGRSVVGLAVGSASFVAPLYVSELAPRRLRGRLVVVQVLFISGGQVVAYVVGWLLSTTLGGWRWMVGLGAVPAMLQLIMLAMMPESPRWLVKAGRLEHAESVLRKVYGDGAGREAILQSVLRAVQKEQEEEDQATRLDDLGEQEDVKLSYSSFAEAFNRLITVPAHRRALVIACMLQGAQQLCGFNSLMYFSATIFSLVGFQSPTLTSLTISITNFLFTLLAFHVIDRVGRRRILLISIPFMIIGLVACSIAFSYLDLDMISTTTPGASASSSLWPSILIFSLIIYVSAYAIGLGSVPWQQGELFPLSVRSVGSGVATSTNWAANTIVGVTFLPMMEALSPSVTFAVYAAVCVGAWWGVWKIFPELAGLSLEEVGEVLKGGWGVHRTMTLVQHDRDGDEGISSSD